MARKITYREAIQEALREEMERDPSVFLMGEDIGKFGGAKKATAGLWEQFGDERVRDIPISESAIIGTALGAALTGFRPVAEIMYFSFIGLAMDQIANQVAPIKYMSGGQIKVPLVIRTQVGGGKSAAAQHSPTLESWFVHVPGLLVVIPSNPYDAKGLLKSSIRSDNPVIFVEHNILYGTSGVVPEDDYIIPLGKVNIQREGDDVTVLTWGRMVSESLKAADILQSEGISLEVIDLRTLFPLDEIPILNSVKKTSRCIIVHEAWQRCGVGAEIASIIANKAFEYLDAPVERLGAANVPIPFAPVLENFVLPNAEKITRRVQSLLSRV